MAIRFGWSLRPKPSLLGQPTLLLDGPSPEQLIQLPRQERSWVSWDRGLSIQDLALSSRVSGLSSQLSGLRSQLSALSSQLSVKTKGATIRAAPFLLGTETVFYSFSKNSQPEH